MLNRQWVSFHLGEAIQELQKVTTALESRAMTREEFEIALEHAYHHINTAWNSRSITNEEAKNHSDTDYIRWRHFPTELNLT
jgi:hypothetical protein